MFYSNVGRLIFTYETEVYKLLRYYPWDEYTNEFYFDVNNPSRR